MLDPSAYDKGAPLFNEDSEWPQLPASPISQKFLTLLMIMLNKDPLHRLSANQILTCLGD